jgi:putative Holliday junction resolvase
MDKGRRLAIDVGTVRIGLAICDPDGILSTPIPAIGRSSELSDTLGVLSELISENSVIEVFVGDPVSLSGTETASTRDARDFAARLAELISVPIRLVDERLTTVTASAKLRVAGKDAKQSKSLIDSASAVEILEQALATHRVSGISPGELVEGSDA